MKIFLFSLLLLLALLVGLLLFLPRGETPLLTRPDEWRASPNVQAITPNPYSVLTDKPEELYFVAGLFEKDGSGRMVSKPFPAPRWISLVVIGDLTRPGNEVYFRHVATDKQHPVRVRTQENQWRRVTLGLPEGWVDTPVQMVIAAGPRKDVGDWFGVSTPRALASGTVLASQLQALRVLPAFAVSLILFLLPGLLPAAFLGLWGRVESVLVVPMAIVFSCLAGYLGFWAYFAHPLFGRAFSWTLLAGSAAALAVTLTRRRAARDLLLSRAVATPLALTALTGFFYLALLYSVDLGVWPDVQARLRFFEFNLAVDSEIPYHLAEPLFTGEDPRQTFPGVVPGWLTSDRPPLQAGLLLLQLPVMHLAGESGFHSPVALYALVASCAFQCAWVPAVWALLSVSGLPRRRAGLALLLVTLTGFSLVNTVFTWPKMLSAALALTAVHLSLFGRERGAKGFPPGRAALLGLAAGLGCLAHGGVAFTLLPLGLLLLLPRYYPGLSRLVAGAAVFLATLLPWSLYQSRYDPPGDALIRMHLTAGSPTWQDDRPAWRNILAAYEALQPGQVLHNKLANLRLLAVAAPDQYPWPPQGTPPRWPVDATSWRRCEFLSLFWSLGLLNAGWAVALAGLWKRWAVPDRSFGVWLPALGVVSVLVWVALMFGPGATVVHQGSYATELLLLVPLAGWIAVLPPRAAYGLLGLQGGAFAAAWLLTSPANRYGLPDLWMVLVAVASFAALVRIALRDSPAEPSPAAGRS
jgi:hypothetical protein